MSSITYTVLGSSDGLVTVKFQNEAGQTYVRDIRADDTAEDFATIMESYVNMVSERVARGMIKFSDAQ